MSYAVNGEDEWHYPIESMTSPAEGRHTVSPGTVLFAFDLTYHCWLSVLVSSRMKPWMCKSRWAGLSTHLGVPASTFSLLLLSPDWESYQIL